jgi:exonuclease SbcD
MRNRLLSREEHAGKSIEELENALREVVSDLLENLEKEADSHDMPRVLAGHFSVAEAEFGSERSVMLGRDVAVFLSSIADPRWDYVALGHIHKHQVLNPDGYPPVVYSGSLERIDFGEEDQEKGFCWVDLARENTTWRFVPVEARPFHTLRIDIREAPDPTAAVLAEIEGLSLDGAIVRVMIQLKTEQEAALREREIEQALNMTAHASLIREVETEVRARLGDLEPQALTPLELVERYFQSREVEEEHLAALLAKAEELVQEG